MDGLDLQALQGMVPMAGTLGIELLEADPGRVVAKMDWAPERCTAGGVMHGGALMSLADTAGGVVAFLNVPDGASGTTTIESKTNLIRAVTGGSVRVESRPVHRGRTLAVIEGKISDDETAMRFVPYPVVAFDLDGTLLRGTSVSLRLAEWMDRGELTGELERAFRAGEISNRQVAEASVGWIAGMTPEEVWAELEHAPWIDGIEETISALVAAGCDVLLGTVTWRFAADMLGRSTGSTPSPAPR
jgi:uncharacterized protein (TIGR00369 family)